MSEPITNIEYLSPDDIADEICKRLRENGDTEARQDLGEAWAVGPAYLEEYEVVESLIYIQENDYHLSPDSEELISYVLSKTR